MPHFFEQGLAVASTLDGLVDVKVKDTKRGYLTNLTILLADEEFAGSDL